MFFFFLFTFFFFLLSEFVFWLKVHVAGYCMTFAFIFFFILFCFCFVFSFLFFFWLLVSHFGVKQRLNFTTDILDFLSIRITFSAGYVPGIDEFSRKNTLYRYFGCVFFFRCSWYILMCNFIRSYCPFYFVVYSH